MTKGAREDRHHDKPHICFVSETPATYSILTGEGSVAGGAELQQTLIATALKKMGYEITFLVPDCGQPAVIMSQQGFRVIKTRKQYRQGWSPHQHLADMFRLFRAMDRAGADVYYQRAHAVITGITALYCRLRGKPFVFSAAHNRDFDGTGRRQVGRLCSMLYDYGLTHATRVIVQTRYQQQLLKERFGINGVLIRSTFDASAARVNGDAEYVLWVSNFREMKRPSMFLDLASRLPHYRFLMVGGPSVDEKSLYEELTRSAESIPNLKLTGAVPYSEVGHYFDKAMVFVNTSSTEGFPNTYLQAWSRGVPVVGTFDPDGQITEHGLGRYCSTLDDLVAFVKELMDDGGLRSSMGRRAIEYVREYHSIDSVALAYGELFTGVVDTSRTLRP